MPEWYPENEDYLLQLPNNEQALNDVLYVDDFHLDMDFPFGTQGRKPKIILRSPNSSPRDYIISGGHRYLFKHPEGYAEQQIWSEVIAYKLSRKIGLRVPPAYLAFDSRNNRPGVLVQFFYGGWWQPDDRYVNAIDPMQGMTQHPNLVVGNLRDNIDLCRRLSTPRWLEWWAKTLAFDALIGNTDRHLENWGFIIRRKTNKVVRHFLAPPFDNGTSLGFIIRDKELRRFRDSNQVSRFIDRGTHHYSWIASEAKAAGHIDLCKTFCERYTDAGPFMKSVIQLTDADINEVLDWCLKFSFIVPFTKERAEFIATQLRLRRDALSKCLGTH